MNIKRHRVVSSQSPFPGITQNLQNQAVQCAENEGWPIPADLPEPLRTVAQASFAHRMVTHVSEHVRDEYHFWSGRPGSRRQLAPSPRRVVAVQWKEGLQAVRL